MNISQYQQQLADINQRWNEQYRKSIIEREDSLRALSEKCQESFSAAIDLQSFEWTVSISAYSSGDGKLTSVISCAALKPDNLPNDFSLTIGNFLLQISHNQAYLYLKDGRKNQDFLRELKNAGLKITLHSSFLKFEEGIKENMALLRGLRRLSQ